MVNTNVKQTREPWSHTKKPLEVFVIQEYQKYLNRVIFFFNIRSYYAQLSIYLDLFSRYPNGVLPDNSSPTKYQGNQSPRVSPSTPPSIEEALKIIHDTERPHASLAVGDEDNGFFLHGAEPSDPPGAQAPGDDFGSAKARVNDRDLNSASTDEVDTGIHVRTEDIQSLDEDSSSLRDYSDIDPDCEAMTRSCPLPGKQERSREGEHKEEVEANPEGEQGHGGDRGSPCPSSAPTLPRSYTGSPASSSGGSGGGLVRMTSFAEQKFRKLEGRSSGGTTTPDSSDLNVPYTHSARTTSSQVCYSFCPSSLFRHFRICGAVFKFTARFNGTQTFQKCLSRQFTDCFLKSFGDC